MCPPGTYAPWVSVLGLLRRCECPFVGQPRRCLLACCAPHSRLQPASAAACSSSSVCTTSVDLPGLPPPAAAPVSCLPALPTRQVCLLLGLLLLQELHRRDVRAQRRGRAKRQGRAAALRRAPPAWRCPPARLACLPHPTTSMPLLPCSCAVSRSEVLAVPGLPQRHLHNRRRQQLLRPQPAR